MYRISNAVHSFPYPFNPTVFMKQAVRQNMNLLCKNLTDARKSAASRLLEAVLPNRCKNFRYIAAFVSLRDEPDLNNLLSVWAETGQLVLPYMIEAGGIKTLNFFRVTDLDKQLNRTKKPFEPIPYLCGPPVQLNKQDGMLVPARAFGVNPLDSAIGPLYRLGRGGGYYDRAIADHPGVHTIGIAFEEQCGQESLPCDPWDRPVHEVISG